MNTINTPQDGSQPAQTGFDRVTIEVRGGMHDGASVTLDAGSYLVGSADHCDFVLRDPSVAAEQMLVHVDRSGAFVRALADGLKDGADRVRSNANLSLTGPRVLQAGPVRIGFRPGDTRGEANWIADLEAKSRESASGERNSGRRSAATIAIAAVLCLGVIGLALSAVRDGGLLGWKDAAEKRAEDVRRQVAELSLAEVTVTRGQNDAVVIGGYVIDKSAAQRLRKAVGSEGVRWSLYPADELVRYAREWLAAQGYRVDVVYAGKGVVELAGSDTGRHGFAEAAARLTGEVPGLAAVRSTITPLPAPVAALPVAKVPEPYVLAGVNGVNTGHSVPYLTSGSTYIFRGGVLKNGMSVIGIESERVVVDDNGTTSTQEVRIR